MIIRKVRRKFGEKPEKVRRKFDEGSEKDQIYSFSETQKRIIQILSENGNWSAEKIAEQLEVGRRSVEKNIKILKECGILIRHGFPRNGYWEVVENEVKKYES